MRASRKPPLLLRSELTGRVWIVTAYSIDARGNVVARTKHDVTDQFNAIVEEALS